MVFTDPPYNALKSWKKDEAKTETRLNPNDWFKNDNMEWDEYWNFLNKHFSVNKADSLYVCCDFRIYGDLVNLLQASSDKAEDKRRKGKARKGQRGIGMAVKGGGRIL